MHNIICYISSVNVESNIYWTTYSSHSGWSTEETLAGHEHRRQCIPSSLLFVCRSLFSWEACYSCSIMITASAVFKLIIIRGPLGLPGSQLMAETPIGNPLLKSSCGQDCSHSAADIYNHSCWDGICKFVLIWLAHLMSLLLRAGSGHKIKFCCTCDSI